MTTTTQEPGVPAGMKAWHGGNAAPADWDGGIAGKLTKAQRKALLWLPVSADRVKDNWKEVSGSALAALERKGCAVAGWTPFPKAEHPWCITIVGLAVRAHLLDHPQ